MAYKMEVNHPDFPKGFPFDCDGIPIDNGSSTTLTADDELTFIGRWGKDVKHFYGHSKIVTLTGSSELSKKEREAAAPEASVSPEPEVIEEMEDSHDTAKEGGE